jgi:AcrR family transcriptional regulator
MAESSIQNQILDAANRLFAQKGYEGASLRAISEEVGIRKPSLLYHFSSKEQLRRAVLERLLSHWNEVLPTILQAATSGSHRFEALVEEVAAFFREDPDRARLLVREMLDRPGEMRHLLREALAPWVAILSSYIERGQAEGYIRDEVDPEAYILGVIHQLVGGIALSGVLGVLLDGPTTDSPARLDRQISETMRVARAGLFRDGYRVDGRPVDLKGKTGPEAHLPPDRSKTDTRMEEPRVTATGE